MQPTAVGGMAPSGRFLREKRLRGRNCPVRTEIVVAGPGKSDETLGRIDQRV